MEAFNVCTSGQYVCYILLSYFEHALLCGGSQNIPRNDTVILLCQ